MGSQQTLEGASLPASVKDLPEPPARLFLHGNVPRGPCVGIVGTRTPTEPALEYARQLSSWLGARGVAIISGGAKGIDGAAHRGALDAKGSTLVVGGSSFDCPFPSDHRELFDQVVASGGGYLSYFETGVEPRRHQFLERNGLLVALCHVLVVVEAPLRSGARNAASWARLLGRPYFAVPAAPWNERGRGCIAELQLGARALAVPGDVLSLLEERQLHPIAPGPLDDGPGSARSARVLGLAGPEPATGASPASARERPARRRRAAPAPGAEPATEPEGLPGAVLRAVRAGALHLDQIAEQVGASTAEVNNALFRLTLSGDIHQGPFGDLTVARR